jgi:hypothetical protein
MLALAAASSVLAFTSASHEKRTVHEIPLKPNKRTIDFRSLGIHMIIVVVINIVGWIKF